MADAKRGKPNWARGLTAASDPRIARNVAARLGKPRGPYRREPFELSSWLSEDKRPAYAHLLGLYLGDGCIAKPLRSYRLEISLDRRYPRLIESCAHSMAAIHPRGRANIRYRRSCVVVNSYWQRWPEVIPQHGAGRKHLRRITLEGWQHHIVGMHPFEFLRGLMESDGSRFDRIVKGKAYPAYQFGNESLDIIGLFCQAADLVGLHYTRSSRSAVSIARRADVARLDALWPPKGTSADVAARP